MGNNNNNNIKIRTFGIFVAAMVLILITCFSYAFSSIANVDSKVDHQTECISDIKEDVSAIRTDVVWIKEAIKNGN